MARQVQRMPHDVANIMRQFSELSLDVAGDVSVAAGREWMLV